MRSQVGCSASAGGGQWFNRRYGFNLAQIGGIFFGTNSLAGLSALAAARIAGRIG
jgi:hypothetical protein